MAHASLFAQLKARRPPIQPRTELQKVIEVDGLKVTLQEDPEGGVGGSVWEAVLTLLHCIRREKDLFPEGHFAGKRIVELGSGTGLGGIVLALMGADVLLTDRMEVVELLKVNIGLNRASHEQQSLSIEAVELEWGSTDVSPLLNNKPPVDYILVSECIYNLKVSLGSIHLLLRTGL